MSKTKYIVVYNLGGVSGPYTVNYCEDSEWWWDTEGDVGSSGNDEISYDISTKHFDSKKDATFFVEGIKWFMGMTGKRWSENLEWIPNE
jgi:hypothetical protein